MSYTHTTRATGTILTALIYNTDHQNHIDHNVPVDVDDYSVNAAQMQAVTSPGTVGSESLATTLAGELERLRFMLKLLHGQSQWYGSPEAIWQCVDVQSVSAQSAITFSGLDTTGFEYRIEVNDCFLATDGDNLGLQVSIATTFATTQYYNAKNNIDSNAIDSIVRSEVDTKIDILPNIGNSSNRIGHATIYLPNLGGTSFIKPVMYHGVCFSNSGHLLYSHGGGAYAGGAQAIDGLRLIGIAPSNITGRASLWKRAIG